MSPRYRWIIDAEADRHLLDDDNITCGVNRRRLIVVSCMNE